MSSGSSPATPSLFNECNSVLETSIRHQSIRMTASIYEYLMGVQKHIVGDWTPQYNELNSSLGQVVWKTVAVENIFYLSSSQAENRLTATVNTQWSPSWRCQTCKQVINGMYLHDQSGKNTTKAKSKIFAENKISLRNQND